jgi:predicted membrane channel-forming protein YqfA (hemolysin III family)
MALGWMILLGMRPMLGSVDALTALLIGVGGVLYSIGVCEHTVASRCSAASETYSERGIARSGHQRWKANLEPLRVFAR